MIDDKTTDTWNERTVLKTKDLFTNGESPLIVVYMAKTIAANHITNP